MEREVLGRSHPVLGRIRRLRKSRAAREEEAVFLAEGVHLAQEAVQHGAAIERALITRRLSTTGEGERLQSELERSPFPLAEISEKAMDSIQDTRSPQPVTLVVRREDREFQALWSAFPAAVVVPCGLQDPGNQGGILRTADAAGCTGFAALGTGADLYHPRAIRSTMGSIFRLPAVNRPDPRELLEELERADIPRIGAIPGSGVPYDRYDWTGPFALFLGPERGGLAQEVEERLDLRVHVPMRPEVNSLSVGAAAAAILFEAARRRRSP